MTLNIANKLAYKAFGFRIASEISLPELPWADMHSDPHDIAIELADLSAEWERQSTPPHKFVVKDQYFLFHVPQTAIYCVRNGSSIQVSPTGGADMDKIRLYILGTCMGALLLQRGIVPLHGSAIEIAGKAYAFIGDSGAGKSTLAAALIRRGYSLVSDDVIAVSMRQGDNGDVPVVVPSYPQQKLWQESLDGFGISSASLRPLFERETKFAVPVTDTFTHEKLPLAGVFELNRTGADTTTIREVHGLETLHLLFRHTYRNFLIDRMGLREWHFGMSTTMAGSIRSFRLFRSSAGFTAEELADLVIKHCRTEEPR